MARKKPKTAAEIIRETTPPAYPLWRRALGVAYPHIMAAADRVDAWLESVERWGTPEQRR